MDGNLWVGESRGNAEVERFNKTGVSFPLILLLMKDLICTLNLRVSLFVIYIIS